MIEYKKGLNYLEIINVSDAGSLALVNAAAWICDAGYRW
jgi:hypothetical protein